MIGLPEGIGLEKLLDAGGELTIRRDPNSGEDYIDLNTGMKSHLYLVWNGEEWEAHGRYDVEYGIITCEEDLMNAVTDCLYGRSYMHPAWQTLLTQKGILTGKLETK